MLKLKLKMNWDLPHVKLAVDKGARGALTAAAIAIRDSARSSMPELAGVASPGQPPHMTSKWLRNSVLYKWDLETKTIVIGPTRSSAYGAKEERNLMRALEFGGVYRLGRRALKRAGKRLKRAGWRGPLPADLKDTRVVFAKPYMSRALERERHKIPRHWDGCVRG